MLHKYNTNTITSTSICTSTGTSPMISTLVQALEYKS